MKKQALKGFLKPDAKKIMLAVFIPLLFFSVFVSVSLASVYCEEVARLCSPRIYDLILPLIPIYIVIMLPSELAGMLQPQLNPQDALPWIIILELLWCYLLSCTVISIYGMIKRRRGRQGGKKCSAQNLEYSTSKSSTT